MFPRLLPYKESPETTLKYSHLQKLLDEAQKTIAQQASELTVLRRLAAHPATQDTTINQLKSHAQKLEKDAARLSAKLCGTCTRLLSDPPRLLRPLTHTPVFTAGFDAREDDTATEASLGRDASDAPVDGSCDALFEQQAPDMSSTTDDTDLDTNHLRKISVFRTDSKEFRVDLNDQDQDCTDAMSEPSAGNVNADNSKPRAVSELPKWRKVNNSKPSNLKSSLGLCVDEAGPTNSAELAKQRDALEAELIRRYAEFRKMQQFYKTEISRRDGILQKMDIKL